LTRRKDGLEIEAMRKAAAIADSAFESVFTRLRAGLTEVQVGKLLFQSMEELGGRPTFAVVATGTNGAEPHHLSDETRLISGDVVIMDFGCELQGYQSDITRVVAIESASNRAQEVYDAVFQAHMAARSVARPGKAGREVDRAARQIIEDRGFGPNFVHRTGHGIGMQVHEQPYISSDNDLPLESGDCFSIEPGIYLPGEFGVRIENIVTLNNDACVSLNAEPSPTLQTAG
jgi:Xaa-Pro dipeptidase